MQGAVQFWGTSTSPVATDIGVGTGASAYTDLVNQYVKTLADGSNASLDDQLAAWSNLGSLLNSRDAQNGSLIYDINKNDAKRAVDAYYHSDLATSLQTLDRQFNNLGLAVVRPSDGGDFNIAQNKLDNLSRFSREDQKKIFFAEDMNVRAAHRVIGGKDIYYADLESWKADLTQQSAAFTQKQDAATATQSAVDPTALSRSVSAIATAPLPPSTSKKSAEDLPGSSAANADIALQLLLTSQDEATREPVLEPSVKVAASRASAYAASQASSGTTTLARPSPA